MNIAKLHKRVVAGIIDFIIVLAIALPVIYFVNVNYPILEFDIEIQTALYKSRGFFIGLAIDLTYTVYLLQSSKSATLGMQAMRMRLVKENGSHLKVGTSLLRYVVSLFSSILLKIGYLYALFNTNNQTVHDYIARTFVIDWDENISENYLQKENAERDDWLSNYWNSLNTIGKVCLPTIIFIVIAMLLNN